MLDDAPTDPLVDLAAERAVLGAVLLDEGQTHATYVRAMRFVRARRISRWGTYEYDGDFADPRHNVIFACMGAVLARGDHLDVVSLAAELRRARGEGRDGLLNTIGGTQYLGEVSEAVPTVVHVETHAKAVTELAAARRLRDAASEVTKLLQYRGVGAYTEALAKLARATQDRSGHATRAMRDVVESAWQQVIDGIEGRRRPVPTGFRGLDGDARVEGLLAGGLHRGDLIVVAADQGGGKTSWALQVSRAAARAGCSVLVISAEMSGEELSWRVTCSDAGIPVTRVRAGRLSNDEIQRLQSASGALMGLDIRVRDSGASVEEIRNVALAAHAERALHLVVVDYVQILDAPEWLDEGKVADVIDRNVRGLKLIARELDVPVLALSQFNRAGQLAGRKPRLQDLKGSGGIESHADVVIVLHPANGRGDGPTPPVVPIDLMVLKQRAGATDEIRLLFERTFTRFVETAREEGALPERSDDAPIGLLPS